MFPSKYILFSKLLRCSLFVVIRVKMMTDY